MDDTSELVQDLIQRHLGCDPDRVTPEANIVDDLGADSLDIVELAIGLETEFGLEIPDDEIEKFVTVGDVTSYIEKNQA